MKRAKGEADQRGLYRKEFEHDACGIGTLVDIKGHRTHALVENALQALVRMSHRGGTGAEEDTGDGAGILTQIPDAFLRRECRLHGFILPRAGEYGVGMLFLAREQARRKRIESHFENIVRLNGLNLLGWRSVPVNTSAVGKTALECMPCIRQVFIQKSADISDTDEFERRLFLVRKTAEKELRYGQAAERGDFYAASLSSRTIVYKGMLQSAQVQQVFLDLSDLMYVSAIALVHSRYSTNTLPSWERAHPNRYTIHNGEINTIHGNQKRMNARKSHIHTDLFGDSLEKVFPIVNDDGSDSAMLDNTLEFLLLTGRSLPHAAAMMVPEPWEKSSAMPAGVRAFYEFHSHVMDAWDGPAAIVATDGQKVLATLDRNGLRPARYLVTKDGLLVMASETGVMDIDEERILYKERLHPGRMLLVDTAAGRIVGNDEIKHSLAAMYPYSKWSAQHRVNMEDIKKPRRTPPALKSSLLTQQRSFGYTFEQVEKVILPMARTGVEPTGAMGTDTPLAVLSNEPQLLYDYFHQRFAQVTNPPIDAIREEIVTSTRVYIGSEGELLSPSPQSCRQIRLLTPLMSNEELQSIRELDLEGFSVKTLSILYNPKMGGEGIKARMDELYRAMDEAFEKGKNIFILSDRGADETHAAIPALLATAGVNTHAIEKSIRTRLSLLLETGEPTEVHHFALLIDYGATAVNPYLAIETIRDAQEKGLLEAGEEPLRSYFKAVNKGIVKVMSKMGITMVQSYRGAQLFEAIGLDQELIDLYFSETVTRIGGIGLEGVAMEKKALNDAAFLAEPPLDSLPSGSAFRWRKDGEYHMYNPEVIHLLQAACRGNDYSLYKKYAALLESSDRVATLRGLLTIKGDRKPIDVDQVESVEDICKRFKTGAMSYGSLSKEAHECLAIAMNRIGGKSNSGEGGEDEERFEGLENGDSRMSKIKQVASGRFGVTANYLWHADEIQIKIAQGAKPGEGGQLPGTKVYPWIAKTRHSTEGVGLISPPPHHDIYSIEDLAELIFDLKNANRKARISVKLVSEAGVGTIAAGVAKGRADVILISGYDGGTGASPRGSIKHAGVPWELGLAETQQTLIKNKLRGRIVIETDGKLMTGRDVAVAALLGAEEFGFATAPLITMGCVMMRVCNLDTCPMGIATQNPELRRRFAGKPEYVVNFMRFVARELREIMAQLGVRTVNELVGHAELLKKKEDLSFYKHRLIDLSAVLWREKSDGVPLYAAKRQEDVLSGTMDEQFLSIMARPALQKARPVTAVLPIRNIDRVTGTLLGSRITEQYGSKGLPENTVSFEFHGHAGQSFGAFIPHGMTLKLLGDANDYLGKGLSGGIIIVRPDEKSGLLPQDNVIAGNVALYGATSGEAYISGIAGERFCVRNSGAAAVVEGVGDHGCEYMTGGRVLIIGDTGRNFGAGMSGGIAYVYDAEEKFMERCNMDMAAVDALDDPEEEIMVKRMLKKHVELTGSPRGKALLEEWGSAASKIKRLMPLEYKAYLQNQKRGGACNG